jgi:hypothetical protein
MTSQKISELLSELLQTANYGGMIGDVLYGKEIPNYVDCEILKDKDELLKKYQFDINDCFVEDIELKKKFVKKLNEYEGCEDYGDNVVKCFSYQNTKYVYIFTRHEENETSEVIIYKKNMDIILVGCMGFHPYIVTPSFTYDNSDGSGPLLLLKNDQNNTYYCGIEEILSEYKKQEITVEKLHEMITYFYEQFCHDNYH